MQLRFMRWQPVEPLLTAVLRRRHERLTRLSLEQATNRSSGNRIAPSGLVSDQAPSPVSESNAPFIRDKKLAMVRFVVDTIPPTSVAPALRQGRVAPERQHDEPPHNQTDFEC